MIRFDTEAPGGGVDAYTIWENQKAEVRFTVYLEAEEPQLAAEQARLELWMRTAEGEETAYMAVRTRSPEDGRRSWAVTVRTLLIQPQLWQGRQAPQLYDVEVQLDDVQTLRLKYPVCSMGYRGTGHFLLNGRPYPLHAVRYLPGAEAAAVLQQDLESLKQLGANCLCLEAFPADPRFYELCLEHGMLLWKSETEERQLPLFCGSGEHPETDGEVLLYADRKHRQDIFYYYQALWSERKVLHICRFSEPVCVDRIVTVTVYSNQKKVALYVNGYLREFKESAPVFVFEDVELTGGAAVLSARSEECFTSYTPEHC